MKECCTNPLCKSLLVNPVNRSHQNRRHCDRRCRLTHWVLKRAATLLAALEQSKAWEILYQRDQQSQRATRPLVEDERLKSEFQKRVAEILAWALARSPGVVI